MSPKRTPRPGPSKPENKSGTKSSSKAVKGSASEKQQQSATSSEWSEWAYDATLKCDYRSRVKEDGSLEYEDGNYDQDIPRSIQQSNVLGGSTGTFSSTDSPNTGIGESLYGLSSSSASAMAPPVLGRYPQTDSAGPVSETTAITRGLHGVQFSRNLSYGTANQGRSMVNDSGIPVRGEVSSYDQLEGEDGEDGEDYDDYEDTGTTEQDLNKPAYSYAIPSHTAVPPSFSSFSTSAINASYENRGEQPVSTLPNQIMSGSTESEHKITAPRTRTLDPDFKVHDAKEFKFARVFKILWSEPKGQAYTGKTKGTDKMQIPAKYGEDCYASIRRFVIFKTKDGHCLCVPILTYGGQATTKRGVKPQDHAIVYTEEESKNKKKNKKKQGQGKLAETGRPTEIQGEKKLNKKAIRITPKTPRDRLDPLSRLNYAKIYTVEYNVKVCFIGDIHDHSIKYFKRDFNLVHTPLPEEENAEFSDETEV